MKNKIILGSANFEQTYGVKKNFIKRKEIKKILNFAVKKKNNLIDTAPVYGRAEKIIGSLGKGKFKIISKIPQKNEKTYTKNWLEKKVVASLKNLKIKKFECLLIHDVNILFSKYNHIIYKDLRRIKKKSLTKKIGISIYDFESLNRIFKHFKFDLVQVPFNIFDQRLISQGWLKKLKKLNIEVHVRSIFLQGTLLLKHKQLPTKLKKYENLWIIWENWLRKNKITALQACLSFVRNQNKIDRIVVGFNNKSQLDKILKIKLIKSNSLFNDMSIKNRKLIDPRQW